MAHQWWLPCVFLLLAVVRGSEKLNKYDKARRSNQVWLLSSLRLQVIGWLLAGLGWIAALLSHTSSLHVGGVLLVVVAVFLLPGLGSIIYGQLLEASEKKD